MTNYIEKYKLDEIIPFDKIEEELKAIVQKYKKKKSFWMWMIIGSLILDFLIFIGMFLLTGAIIGGTIAFMIIGILMSLMIVAIILYFSARRQENREKRNSAGARYLQNLPLTTFYNRIIEFNPPLHAIKVVEADNYSGLVMNTRCEQKIKSFSFVPSNLIANKIVFEFKGKLFLYSIEFLNERVVTYTNSKGRRTVTYYHTFMDTMVCHDLLENVNNKYGVFANPRKSIDSRWKKFESESIVFNKKYHIYYYGDDIEVFSLFNPLVLDKFTSKPMLDFQRFYINAAQGTTYKCTEVNSSIGRNVSTLYGFVITGNDSLVDDINENMERFEKNIAKLKNHLQYFVPFIVDLGQKNI